MRSWILTAQQDPNRAMQGTPGYELANAMKGGKKNKEGKRVSISLSSGGDNLIKPLSALAADFPLNITSLSAQALVRRSEG